jgi:3-ketosteroid 9alpha-monooxygenase subunit A
MSYGFGFGLVRFRGLAETLLVSCTSRRSTTTTSTCASTSRSRRAGANVAKGVGARVREGVSRQLGQDIPIWENKIQHEQPLLCDGDGPIGMFRRWCQQFYAYPKKPSPRSDRTSMTERAV